LYFKCFVYCAQHNHWLSFFEVVIISHGFTVGKSHNHNFFVACLNWPTVQWGDWNDSGVSQPWIRL